MIAAAGTSRHLPQVSEMQHEFSAPNRLLLGAGPSNVPRRVLHAISRPTVGHLDPWFLALTDEVNAMLRSVFQTSNHATFPVSGTGTAGMETMLVNFLEPGDRIVVGVCGVFGERIASAAERLGAEVVRVSAEPGRSVSREEIALAMRERAVALALVHAETSTGVVQSLEGLGDLVRERDALLLVDCVTSLGGYPLAVDGAGIDVAFSGTQKCLNCPPGLAPITIGERALARLKRRRRPVPSWCFDVSAILDYWSSDDRRYHHTPPVNSIYGLHEALRIVLEEGLESRWRRHAVASDAVVAGLEQLDLEALVFADERLWPLTTVRTPSSSDEAAVRQTLLEEHRIEVSAGLGALKGQVWRVGTMGVNASLGVIRRLIESVARILDPEVASDAVERATAVWRSAAGKVLPGEAVKT
jgi:alanine-glyoxylate transaminase/serine-glyoxylate transaminase/serine-pyruvate transaminase